MFSGYDLPSIGISIGIERIISLYENKFSLKPPLLSSKNSTKIAVRGSKTDKLPLFRAKKTELLIASTEKNLALFKAKLCASFRVQGINSEYVMSERLNAQHQINLALDDGCPFMVFVEGEGGQDGKIQFKDMTNGDRSYLTFEEIVDRIKGARGIVCATSK